MPSGGGHAVKCLEMAIFAFALLVDLYDDGFTGKFQLLPYHSLILSLYF
jgi:hypothetical protein